MDSGNDSLETLKATTAVDKGLYCIIKRYKQKKSDAKWLKIAERYGKQVQIREGKSVWIETIDIPPRKKNEIANGVKCLF